MGVIRGKVKEIVFKHDASRIVQTLVKHGRQAERDEVAVELKGHYRDLAQNKYSKVCLPICLIGLRILIVPSLVSGHQTYPSVPHPSCLYPPRISIARAAAPPASGSNFRTCRCL